VNKLEKILKEKTWAVVSIMILFLSSCATTTVNNLTPSDYIGKPYASVFSDPNVHLEQYQTFSVFPLSSISDKVKMNPILEKQLLFYVRNLIESKGYEFVQMDQKPDFLVTLNANSEYKEFYVPPSQVTVPYWVPGKDIIKNTYSSGTVNLNTLGNSPSYGFGSWRGSGMEITHVPGYMASNTYTKPGYTVGHYYPAATIFVYDRKTLKEVWEASGAAVSNNPNMSVSEEGLLSYMIDKYPYASASNYNTKQIKIYTAEAILSDLGIKSCTIFTNDGISYFPTVGINKDSIAEREGLKDGDMIIEINGVSTLNKSFSEIANLLVEKPGAELNIKVKRLNEILQLTIPIDWKKEADLYNKIGVFCYKKGYFKESINYIQNAVEIYKKHEYNQALDVTLNNLGYIYTKLKDYPKAEKYLLDGLNIAKNINDKHEEANILNNLGYIYTKLKDYPKAEKYFLDSLNIAKNINDKHEEGANLGLLGYIYTKLKDYPKAEKYLLDSLNIAKNINDKHEEGANLGLLGYIYTKLKDYPKAEKYLLDSLNIAKNIDDKHAEATIYSHFGEFYEDKGDKKTAESYFAKSYNLYKSIGDNDDAQMIYDKHLKK